MQNKIVLPNNSSPSTTAIQVAVLAALAGTIAISMFGLTARKRKGDDNDNDPDSKGEASPMGVHLEFDREYLVQSCEEIENEEREQLSEVDQWLSKSSHWLPFCFRFDAVLDVEKVIHGLSRTLAHVPVLGGRYDAKRKGIIHEIVLRPDRNGVPLQVYRGSLKNGLKLPDATSSTEDWKRGGLGAPAAGFDGEPGPNDPLMRIKLTIFDKEGVTFLSVGISHGIGDGHSVNDILQIWSYFCSSEDSSGLPETLARKRVFGQRKIHPIQPAKDLKDLWARTESDVGCAINPLSSWAFYGHLMPRAVWSICRQRIIELRVCSRTLSQLKETIPFAQGEWVSRFELLFAALLLAKVVTSQKRSRPYTEKLFVACNLRGRTSRFQTDYFGNAAFDYCEPITLPGSSAWDEDSLLNFANAVHRAVRRGLQNPENILRTKDWFEAARHLGLTNKYDLWPILLDTFKGTGTFVNSWDKRWLELSMGSGQNASSMMTFFGVAENLLVEVPRDAASGDTTVKLALPANHAKDFVAFTRRPRGSIPFPFEVVNSREDI